MHHEYAAEKKAAWVSLGERLAAIFEKTSSLSQRGE
jgi:hypothetical protein